MLRNLAACRFLTSPRSQQHWSGSGKHHAPADSKSGVSPLVSHIPLPPKRCWHSPGHPALPWAPAPLTSQRLQCSSLRKGLSLFLALLSAFLKCFVHLCLLPSLIKCFQYWNNVGKRGWKGIKDLHCIKKI